jgi:uncharacterized integral membrane protein
MVRIIVTVVLVALLAVLIAMNAGSRATLNFYGAEFKDVPVVLVAALAFVLGIVYSLFLYFSRYLRRKAKDKVDTRKKDVSERERLLAEKEAAGAGSAGPAGTEEQAAKPGAGRFLRGKSGKA